MEKLKEEIESGRLRQFYLLYGEEAYLLRQYRDKLKTALINGDDTMNYNYFEGKSVDVGKIIDLAETLPFLADRRVIIIENSGLFKHGGEQLAEYIKEPCETTFFVLVEPEIDKRSKLFKALTAKGRAVEFKAQDQSVLKRWILSNLKKENKKITERDLSLFLEMTGTDMDNISKELEKLVCFCMDKEVITGKDIEEICTRQINDRIFDMIGAIAGKRQKEAMELYYDLLQLNVNSMSILSLLAKEFNKLLQVKELRQKGYPAKAIAENVGLPEFVVGKYVNQAAKFSTQYLRNALTDCVETDEAIKTGKMKDVLSVELLIIKYSA